MRMTPPALRLPGSIATPAQPAPRDTTSRAVSADTAVAKPRDTTSAARPADSAIAAKPTDICDSPASADQQQCLMSSVQRNDAPLNDVYQRLIVALRHQAGAQDADPDPQSVLDLRDAQRKWLESRDAACHGAGDGPLYARTRAQCFADQSAQRTRELQQMLAAIPGAA
jgi:uncharacterized protein YecT (DUF1311 family)